jgi:hypothetical protein
MFVVVKEGVYHQGTWGPFRCEEEAIKRARELAAADTDHYHSWVVRRIDPVHGLGSEAASFDKRDV